MNKTAKTLLLLLAAFFVFIGIKSSQHSTAYAELTNIKTTTATISKLHCPPKGAAAFSLTDSDATYNLSIKFRADYCDDDNAQVLLGREVTLEYVQVNDNFYQVYQLTENDRKILSPEEVEADQSSATFGLFFLAFLLVALVVYKSRTATKK